MDTTTLPRTGEILVDDELPTHARRFVHEAGDRATRGVTLRLDDGSTIDLPEALSEFVMNVLHGLSHGGISVRTFPPELTTTSAAEILGVSRPTLMKWVKQGRLPSHLVGSHHRFNREDVLALHRQLRADHDDAFAGLRTVDEELASTETE